MPCWLRMSICFTMFQSCSPPGLGCNINTASLLLHGELVSVLFSARIRLQLPNGKLLLVLLLFQSCSPPGLGCNENHRSFRTPCPYRVSVLFSARIRLQQNLSRLVQALASHDCFSPVLRQD